MLVEKVESGLAALEAQPQVIRGLVLRQIAEARLEGQRKVYRTSQTSNQG